MDWEKKHQRGVHSVVAAWSRLELRYSGAGAPGACAPVPVVWSIVCKVNLKYDARSWTQLAILCPYVPVLGGYSAKRHE